MPLTLSNSLVNKVASKTKAISLNLRLLGNSLLTGKKADIAPVDRFLGGSLTDKNIKLRSVAENTAYSYNMLTVAENCLDNISKSMHKLLKLVATIPVVAVDKQAVLYKQIENEKEYIKTLIQGAKFDGKQLLTGKINYNMQAGGQISESINIKLSKMEILPIFRDKVTRALNDYLANGNVNLSTYYNTLGVAARDADAANGENLIYKAITDPINPMTSGEFGAAMVAVVAADPELATIMEGSMPIATMAMAKYGGFKNATATQIANEYGRHNAGGSDFGFSAHYSLINEVRNALSDMGDIEKPVDPLPTDTFTHLEKSTKIAQASIARLKASPSTNNYTSPALLAASDAAGYNIMYNSMVGADNTKMNLTQYGAAIFAVQSSYNSKQYLDELATQYSNKLFADYGRRFVSAFEPNIRGPVDAGGNTLADPTANIYSEEIHRIMRYHKDIDNKYKMANTSHIGNVQNALDCVRMEQASITNQKNNIIAIADALRATSNTIEKSAADYLSTDYVATAQEYGEDLRKMTAAISAVQTSNKVPESTMQLISSLVR